MTAEAFDRERGLADWLKGIDLPRLEAALARLAGGAVRLLDADGKPVLGAAKGGAGAARLPLRLDLETAGYLEAAGVEPGALAAMVALVELLLDSTMRYRMAADLHEEAVREDYAALQQKHAALEVSEARYRKLTEELEQRVREQVKTIDAAQRQLYQVEKLASVGQLAAGVAHEINNPIGFIRSNLNTARSYAKKIASLKPAVAAGDAAQTAALWQQLDMDFLLDDFVALLDDSIVGADRVARIVTDLKGFSNVDRQEEAVIDLNDNLEAACKVVATRLPAGVTIEQDLHPLPPFLCLPGHLNQVFLNLLLNAAQAVPAGTGRVVVRSAAADEEIVIEVGDNGCGIAPENLARVFDPFFTTRAVGQGTGLGLTVSRDIVLVHNGSIDIQSRPGAGTTVTIRLPV